MQEDWSPFLHISPIEEKIDDKNINDICPFGCNLKTITDEGHGLGEIPMMVLPNFDAYYSSPKPSFLDCL